MGKRQRRRDREGRQPLPSALGDVISRAVTDEERAARVMEDHAPMLDLIAGEASRDETIGRLNESVGDALTEIRDIIDRSDPLDLVTRFSVREIAIDPMTYQESTNDGLAMSALLVQSLAAESLDPDRLDRAVVDQQALERLHTLARRVLTQDRFRVSLTALEGGHAGPDPMISRAMFELGPPSWPGPREELLDLLFPSDRDAQFEATTGFSMEALVSVYIALRDIQGKIAIVVALEPGPLRMRISGLEEQAKCRPDEVRAVLRYFSNRPGAGDRLDPLAAAQRARDRPILVSGEAFACVSPDLLLWAVQARFERELKLDSANFDRYQKHRASVLERRARQLISELIEPDMLIGNALYESSLGAGELDGLLVIDRVAIVIEAKGQILSDRARRGDPLRLKANLDSLLGAATEQLGRFKTSLAADGSVVLSDRGREVRLRDEEIDTLVQLVVTLDDLGPFGPSTALQYEAELKIHPDSNVICVSLYGLATLCQLFAEPWAFIHYLSQRQRLSEDHLLFAPEELDIACYYAASGLPLDAPTDCIVEFPVSTDSLDSWQIGQMGVQRADAARPKQQIGTFTTRLLDALARERPTGWTSAAIEILDLSGEGRRQLEAALKDIRKRIREDGLMHSFTMESRSQTGDPCGSTLVFARSTTAELRSKTRQLTESHLARAGAGVWVGISGVVSGARLPELKVAVARRRL